MTGRPGPDRAQSALRPDMQGMTRDWITIWQSEMNAASHDTEAQEAFTRLVAIWAGMAHMATSFIPQAPVYERPDATRAGAPEPPRPAPVIAAPDARDAALERLARRVEELERRLAQYERRPDERSPTDPELAGDHSA